MKTLMIFAFVLIASFVSAGEIEVYDYSTGQYRFFDVQRYGNTIEVFDYQEGRLYEVTEFGKDRYEVYGTRTDTAQPLFITPQSPRYPIVPLRP